MADDCSQHWGHLNPPGGIQPHQASGPSLRKWYQLSLSDIWTNHQQQINGCWNTSRMIADVLQSLRTTWGLNWKAFFLQDIKSISGKLKHIACTMPWLRLLLLDLYASIVWCLRLHHNHLSITNKQFRMLLKLQEDKEAPCNHCAFALACTANATHLLRHQHFITTPLWEDLSLIMDILGNVLVLLHCPIAHLIPRYPSIVAYSDSSSHLAGAY